MRFKTLFGLFFNLILAKALETENSIYYGDTPQNFLPLSQTRLRVRREEKSSQTKIFDVDNIDQTATIPSDIEKEELDIVKYAYGDLFKI